MRASPRLASMLAASVEDRGEGRADGEGSGQREQRPGWPEMGAAGFLPIGAAPGRCCRARPGRPALLRAWVGIGAGDSRRAKRRTRKTRRGACGWKTLVFGGLSLSRPRSPSTFLYDDAWEDKKTAHTHASSTTPNSHDTARPQPHTQDTRPPPQFSASPLKMRESWRARISKKKNSLYFSFPHTGVVRAPAEGDPAQQPGVPSADPAGGDGGRMLRGGVRARADGAGGGRVDVSLPLASALGPISFPPPPPACQSFAQAQAPPSPRPPTPPHSPPSTVENGSARRSAGPHQPPTPPPPPPGAEEEGRGEGPPGAPASPKWPISSVPRA